MPFPVNVRFFTSSNVTETEKSPFRSGVTSMPEGKQYVRTVLITGSTSGIGRQTAADLAAHPHNKVIIHGVTDDKCQVCGSFLLLIYPF